MRAGFDAARIAQDAHAAMDQIGTDEAAVYRSLQGLNTIQAAAVRKCYRGRFGSDLDSDLREEMEGEELERAQLQLEGRAATADAVALHDAVAGLGTDEAAIRDLLRSKSQEEIETIRAEFQARYGESLEDALHGDLDEGNERDQADALLRGDTATADAIAIDDAMRGGFLGLGTSEEEITATYQRIRDEVRVQADREGWNSAQLEAEVRRRTGRVEQRFGERYANVEEYRVPGMEGQSVLRQAFAGELSGPELDLANALADNDRMRADMARIEIERQSVYADDEAINRVLRSQDQNALEDVRRDQGSARHMVVEREISRLLEQNPNMSEEELSRARFRLEHQMERTLEDQAQQRSQVSMEALQNAYDTRYGRPLWYVVGTNMSGNDLDRARAMLRQGGRLTTLQEIEYATRGTGTDEDALRGSLTGLTREEIQRVRSEWESAHPGESFDEMVRSELSGRDEFDIMDMVEHGAPESASERIAEQRRHAEHELSSQGVLGGLAAGREEAWLQRQIADLNRLEPDLYRTDLPPERRAELRDEIDMRVGRVESAVEDHRRAIDSVTDIATQIVGLTVGLAVAGALTFLSGGALGPVMIAVIASAASTLATIGTKRLIQGEAYGIEAIGTDLAVGVVDALTAAATAGMGGRILRGAEATAGVATRAIRPTQVTRLAARFGESALGQRLARLPGVAGVRGGLSRLNAMESGFLTRGITGQNPLARMARSNSAAMRVMAELMAEGVENAVSAAPSAFVGTALADETWHGNVLLNLIQGTGMGVGTGVLMGGVMQGGGHAFHGVRGHIRLSTPEGRLVEANRILGEAFQRFQQENPGAGYGDFLTHPAGQQARAEVRSRGLLSPEPAPRAESPAEAAPAARPEAEPGARPAEPSARRADTAPRPPEPAARPAAEPGARPAEASADARAQALRDGLPQGMGDNVTVHADPTLTGRTVRVVPDVRDGLVVGVRIAAGPDARPIDIMLHAPVVQGMQRYSGLLGRIRTLLERFDAWFHLETRVEVGSTAWEARLELQKLPAIIEQRMHSLAGEDLDPHDQARLLADVANLSRQIDTHQTAIDARDTSRGRGYVAAEERPPFAPEQIDAVTGRRFDELSPEEIQARVAQGRRETAAASEGVRAAEERVRGTEDAMRDLTKARDAEIERYDKARRGLETKKQNLEAERTRLQQAGASAGAIDAITRKIERSSEAIGRAKDRIAEVHRRYAADAEFSRQLNQLEADLHAKTAAFEAALADQQRNSAQLIGALTEERARLAAEIRDKDAGKTQATQEISRLEAESREKIAKRLDQIGERAVAQRVREGKPIDRDVAMQLGQRHPGIVADIATIHGRYKERVSKLQSRISTLEAELSAARARETAAAREIRETRGVVEWQEHRYDDFGRIAPCFLPNTIVKTPDGDRRMDDLAAGELVCAYDFEHDCVVLRSIAHVWRNWTQKTVVISLEAERIFATPAHRFWLQSGNRWTAASLLQPRQLLRDIEGAPVALHQTEWVEGRSETLNLEIEGAHNYFVGATGVLVHNEDPESKFLDPHRKPTVIYEIVDARTGKVIYVGKTDQGGGNEMERFREHMREIGGKKTEWATLYEQGLLKVYSVERGNWTEFETAVWEQHYIVKHGRPRTENSNSTLLNDRNEITEATYRRYKDARLPNGQPMHNPCSGR